ncbi:MAG: aminoacyl-tRNA hydrolase [Bacteriovoracaceae bacterium]
MIRLVCGLGNPGNEYAKTRHNIGFMALDRFNFNWQKKFKALYTQENFKSEKVLFLKPQTFMNLSGESVVDASQFFKIDITEILVVYDEIDIPYGTVQLKKGGGLAGHNGLKSIAGLMGSDEFYRLRLGVSRPIHGTVANHVLGEFSSEEKKGIDSYILEARNIIEFILNEGFEKASQKYSKKSFI